MSAKSAEDLLPAVRAYVLQEAARGSLSIGLSLITRVVDGPAIRGNHQYRGKPIRRLNYLYGWSQQKRPSKLGHRGWVQACLSKLAKEGLMWERQRPECGHHYEPCDKFFRIRIKKEDAIAKLKELGLPLPTEPQQFWSLHWTKSLKV